VARANAGQTLRVFLNDRYVGRVQRQRNGAISFQYDIDWLAWEHTMPISLSLPLDERRYSGSEVIAVLDNLLPDEPSVRAAVAESHGATGTDPYSLLASIGRDCVGALQFLPEGVERSSDKQLDATEVDDTTIADIITNLARTPLGLQNDDDHGFRISIAGAQEKTALLKLNDRWYRPNGTTPTTHILKPSIGHLPNGPDFSTSVENEFYCLKLLQAFGLSVNNADIKHFEEHKTLVVERFDRIWSKDGRLLRLPQEDMCQALSVNSAQKYETHGGPGIVEIMQILTGSDKAVEDRQTFFKVQVLFWLMGATDGHAKNFSILLRPNNSFALAPLYDVMTLQPAVDQKQLAHKHFKLSMSVGNRTNYSIKYITGEHLLQSGKKAGLSTTNILTIFDDVRDHTASALAEVEKHLPDDFPENIHRSVSSAALRRRDNLTLR